LNNPRVVNAHREALKAGIKQFYDACLHGWDQAAADALLLKILSARDHDTVYVVATRNPTGSTEIYGPYASVATANRAIEMGVCANLPGARSGIFPLYPAPRAVRPRK